jgi:hypothetical protein
MSMKVLASPSAKMSGHSIMVALTLTFCQTMLASICPYVSYAVNMGPAKEKLDSVSSAA